MIKRKRIDPRSLARLLMAGIYLAAGLAHLIVPAPFVVITPSWVPLPELMVALTGLMEIVGAVALMTSRFRRAAGVGLALYAVCVFPANIQHAIDSAGPSGGALGWWYHGPRLLFQPVIVWWALWVGEVIDWPFRPRAADRP